MRCEELKDLIPLRAVGMLEPGEDSAVREHLDAGCPACTAEMAAVRELIHMLPFALEPGTPSPMAKARLMAAVRAESAPRAETLVTAARATWKPGIAIAVAASLLTAVVTGYVMTLRHASMNGSSPASKAIQ